MTILKKIVVIDDEVDFTLLVKKILEKTGKYCVYMAEDGFAGEKLCLQEKPDLILLDIVLPKIRGKEVYEFLKTHEETKHIPVIVISGLDEDSEMFEKQKIAMKNMDKAIKGMEGSRTITIGGNEKYNEFVKVFGESIFLSKPFPKELLLEVIEKMLKANE